MKNIGIAMAGYGGIGRVHRLAYEEIRHFYPGRLPAVEMLGVLASSADSTRKIVSEVGFRKGYGSYHELLNDPEVDVVDIVTPNYLHKDQIIDALRAGKHVICEKPLALNSDETDEILEEALKSDRRFGMVFNFRFIPAIRKARELIDQGRLGKVYSFRGEFFHTGYQDPNRPFSWRMDFTRSGGGALADLGVHILDLLMYLLGDIQSVRAELETYIPFRPLAGQPLAGQPLAGQPLASGDSSMAEVTVDDAAWLLCSLRDGGRGTVEVSRFATGTNDDMNITVYGSKASFRFKLMEPGYLDWFEEENGEGGWQRIETLQKYPEAVIPNPRSVVGWTRFHTENLYRFLEAVYHGTPVSPDVADGARAQYVLDAAIRSSVSGNYEDVKPVISI